VDPDGRANAQSISADQDWYFSKNLMQQKVDVNQVVDNQYIEYALQRLGKYLPLKRFNDMAHPVTVG